MKMTEDFLKKAVSMAREMMSENDVGCSVEENLAAALAARLPEENGEETVAELLAGDHDFHEALRQIEENDSSDRSHGIDEALIGLTLAEQYRKLAGVLNQFQAALGQSMEEEGFGDSAIKEIPPADVTQEDIQELKRTLAELEETLGVVFFENEDTAQFTEYMGGAGLETSEIDVAQVDDSKRYYLELAIYILHRQGEFVEIPSEVSVRSIGGLLAAAFEAAKTKILGIMGKIPWAKMVFILNKIADAVLTLYGFALLFTVGTHFFGFVFMQNVSIIVLMIYLAFLVGDAKRWVESGKAEAFVSNMAATWNKISEGTCQWIGEKAETVLGWWETFTEWLKEKAEPLWRKLTSKLPKDEEQTQEVERTARYEEDCIAAEDNYVNA